MASTVLNTVVCKERAVYVVCAPTPLDTVKETPRDSSSLLTGHIHAVLLTCIILRPLPHSRQENRACATGSSRFGTY